MYLKFVLIYAPCLPKTFNLNRTHVYDLVDHITSIFEIIFLKSVMDGFLIELKVRCYSKITYEKVCT